MSLCEDMLVASNSGYAWVTACSHVFCDQHGSGELSCSPAICALDIVHTELSPSEKYKAMVLAGLRQEIVHQERLYQENNFIRAEGHLTQMEKIYTQQIQSKDVELTSTKGEVTSMKKVLEEYKKKFSDISEKLKERNLQYQKLQGLYDSLRLRNIPVANHEGITTLSFLWLVHLFEIGAMEIFSSDNFFVGSPIAPEPSNSLLSFASPSGELEQQQVSSRAFKVKRI
uniref:Uncharacterized protein n=1 Tax=Rhinopithecus roxellana TaxID=61622 RepID=A0A2K6QVS6_RHIRO